MKFLLISLIVILLSSCGTRETIKKRYLYSETVMQLLSDEEYYQLDKDSECVFTANSFSINLNLNSCLKSPLLPDGK